jgi:O-antigen/teichoic acid export membrane protein
MTVTQQPRRHGRLTALSRRWEPRLRMLRGSDTAKASGLAAAMIANNVIALGSTVVFARLLSDYGSLAALISYFLILSVAGQALQVATAREGVLGHLGLGPELLATLRRWTVSMALITAALSAISVALRGPIARLVGVGHDPWAAAIGLPAGCLWLELSLFRGALQGVGDYRSVGLSLIFEQATRLATGAALAAAGLGVTGAYLGTPISFIAMCAFCLVYLRRYARMYVVGARVPAVPTARRGPQALTGEALPAPPSLWVHVRRAWAPIGGLIVIAVLQNIDLIAAKHRLHGTQVQSSYAAAAVAAKVLVWVAMGASFYLVPEVARRRSAGEETRPVLLKALAIVAVCAVPVLLIFAFGAHPLLRIAFGAKKATAWRSLLVLGLAFSVLACTYLAIQYMLALKRTWFLVVVGAVAIVEPVLLLQASRQPQRFAAVVLGVQAVAALLAFALALRRDSAPPATAANPEPA